jgi:hypothetical protein
VRAEDDARHRLDDALRHGVYPVPCPHCGLYQLSMIPIVRAAQFPGMRSAVRMLLGLVPTSFALGCMGLNSSPLDRQ